MKDLLVNFRGSILLGVAAVVLGAVCLVLLGREDTRTGSIELFNLSPKEAVVLRVAFPGEGRPTIVARLDRKTGYWMLAEPVADRADTQVVERILTYFCTAKAPKRWEEGSVEAQEMGPVQVRIAVEFRNGTSHTLDIGNKTASGFRAYGRASSKEGVFEISKAFLDAAVRSLLEYRQRRLFDVDYTETEDVEVQDFRSDRRHRMRLHPSLDDEWDVLSPYEASGNAERIFDFVYKLDRMVFGSFLEKGSLPAGTGLDRPAVKVVLRDREGAQSEVDFSRVEREGKVLWFARVHGRDVAGRVETSRIDAIFDFKKPWRFRERRLLSRVGKNIVDISVTGSLDERNVSFRAIRGVERTEYRIVEPQNRSVDGVLWPQFIEKLIDLNVEAFVSENPSEEDLGKAGLREPAVVLAVRSAPDAQIREETRARIALGGVDPERGIWFARRDGSGPIVGLPVDFRKFLERGFLRYIDRGLYPIDGEDVQRITLEDAEGKVVIEKGEGGQMWRYTHPRPGVADDSLIKVMLERGFQKAGGLWDMGPFPEGRLPALGLDKTRLLTVTFDIEKHTGEKKKITIHISPRGPSGEQHYAMYEPGHFPRLNNVVFSLPRSTVDNLLKLAKLGRD
jgi:hypothetical protein